MVGKHTCGIVQELATHLLAPVVLLVCFFVHALYKDHITGVLVSGKYIASDRLNS
jgi:hypothetical protein